MSANKDLKQEIKPRILDISKFGIIKKKLFISQNKTIEEFLTKITANKYKIQEVLNFLSHSTWQSDFPFYKYHLLFFISRLPLFHLPRTVFQFTTW